MKKAFQLCESCNLQPSCPTGVALDSSECGKEIEIRTCKAYVQVKRIIPPSSPASEEEIDEAQRDYETAADYQQYCETYEQTYDPDTGAM